METLDGLANLAHPGEMVRMDDQDKRDLMVLLAHKVIEEILAAMGSLEDEGHPVLKEDKVLKDRKVSKEIVDAMRLVLEVMKAEPAHQVSLALLDLLEETVDAVEMVIQVMMGEEANPVSLERTVHPVTLAWTVKLQSAIQAALMAIEALRVFPVPQVNEALTLKMALTVMMAVLVALVLVDQRELADQKDLLVMRDHKERMANPAKMDQPGLLVLLVLPVIKVIMVLEVLLEKGVHWVNLDMDVMAIPVTLATLAKLVTVVRREHLSKVVKVLLDSLVLKENLELMAMLANQDQTGQAGILDREEIQEILVLQE